MARYVQKNKVERLWRESLDSLIFNPSTSIKNCKTVIDSRGESWIVAEIKTAKKEKVETEILLSTKSDAVFIRVKKLPSGNVGTYCIAYTMAEREIIFSAFLNALNTYGSKTE